MPSLADLQQQLRGAITGRTEEPLDLIVSAGLLPASKRLGVYSDAYILRLLECLASDFPATRRVLGEIAFRQLAADYFQKHPSSSPNVSDLGEALPEFIQSHRLAVVHPYLPDLIRLEWAALQSLFTDRLPPLNSIPHPNPLPSRERASRTGGTGAGEGWFDARITLDPTVRLLKTEWAVDTLWEQRRISEKKGSKRLTKKKFRALLLYRDDAWLQIRVIDEPRWFTLKQLQEGTSLGKVCEELPLQFPRPPWPVMDWFAHWIHAGIIKKIEI